MKRLKRKAGILITENAQTIRSKKNIKKALSDWRKGLHI